MAEPTLEDKLNAPHGTEHGEKKEHPPKIQTPLEEIVSGVSGIAKLGIAAAIPFGFGAAFPGMARDAAILSGAQVASDYTNSVKSGKKYTTGNMIESTALGTGITPVVEGMFGAVNRMPLNTAFDYFAKAAVWGGLCYPAFVAAYQPMAYLIRNRKFNGMLKYVRENYWPTLKNAWTKLLPFSLMNVFFAPTWLQIPISAALSYAFDLFGAPHKEELTEDKKRVPGEYYRTIPSVAAKAAKTLFYGIPEVVYNAGKRLADATYGAKTSAPAHAAAPSHT